jgi:hypothetical protein
VGVIGVEFGLEQKTYISKSSSSKSREGRRS